MMIRITIDARTIEVEQGATILDAARLAGVSIPTLCHYHETGALTSCMVCVVENADTGAMLPACAAHATDGMRIDATGPRVVAARREILRMLLSEHVGDCEAPCTRVCPAGLDVPRMLRHLCAGETEAAARIAARDLILPSVLGRICPAPCKKACRRSTYDSSIDIPRMHSHAIDCALKEIAFAPATSTGKSVAIIGASVAVIGASLAGLAAASICAQQGHTVHVYEKEQAACAELRAQVPADILDAEIARIAQQGVTFHYGCSVDVESLTAEHHGVLVACGAIFEPAQNVFDARKDKMPARAIANGKTAARKVDALLTNAPPPLHKRYNCQIGRLRPEETAAYAVERIHENMSPETEAHRCLHCDCAKPLSCKLRRYAQEYGITADDQRGMARQPVQPMQRADHVLYDPGKCIKCGICVELTRIRGNMPGLAFSGRGARSRVTAPLNFTLAQALGDSAVDCVQACPTGALALDCEEDAP